MTLLGKGRHIQPVASDSDDDIDMDVKDPPRMEVFRCLDVYQHGGSQ